jgi:8-oxo-dGTP pyrophosphatase MutT (NUDIX family)
VHACNNTRLPSGLPFGRRPFLVGDHPVGWVSESIIEALAGNPMLRLTNDQLILTDPSVLPALARGLSEQGLFRHRGEAFDVWDAPGGAPLAQIDRGALPAFGIQAAGVHVNGLVRRTGNMHMWVARRAKDKHLDPNKLDHIVAGGVSAGLNPALTLVKEAAEEASITPEIARRAVHVGLINYTMERSEGLRRDWLYCYDLILPETFTPLAADGEVEGFELWPIAQVMEVVHDTDDFKFNVNLVLIDLFIRLELIQEPEASRLRAML